VSVYSDGTKAIPTAIAALVKDLGKLWTLLRRFAHDVCRAARRLGNKEGRGSCCVDVPPSVLVRADPMIYDQYYLMGMGLSVTWDNPDMDVLLNGSVVPPSDLAPDTEYDVRVRVWNGSYDAPAIGLLVELSFLSFGVGTQSTYVGGSTIDLGPKASATAPAFAWFRWTTPSTPGHYCLQARLVWPNDANPDNNLGQLNTQVGVAHSPATVEFEVRNDAAVARVFDFEVDAYTIPPLERCPSEPTTSDGDRRATRRPGRLSESRARWDAAVKAQGYGSVPLEAGWSVDFDPAMPTLDPGGHVTVRAVVELPPGGAVSQAVNVHCFARANNRHRSLAGGVTLLVERS
jgi:hypothetical protein